MSNWTYDDLIQHNRALTKALRPFAKFAKEDDFYLLPNDEPMTGDHANHNHVTAGDFKVAHDLLFGSQLLTSPPDAPA